MVGASLRATCTDPAGNSVNSTFSLNYDATPPTITHALRSRRPDHHGWYNHPVRFAFTGTDAVSGIEGCSSVTYAGPASATASLTGSCTDRAGNVATLGVGLRYDATPPSIQVGADPGDGTVALHWRTADVAPLTSLEVTRAPGLNGAARSVVHRGDSGSYLDSSVSNGVRYRYTITARDQADNVAVRTLSVTPNPRILAPAPGAQMSEPPLLEWTPAPGASYYNVQLYRDGAKVLSTWPAHAHLQLAHRWSFHRRRYRLKPGHYRWYVWPGFGPRATAQYGALIGTGTFVIAP